VARAAESPEEEGVVVVVVDCEGDANVPTAEDEDKDVVEMPFCARDTFPSTQVYRPSFASQTDEAQPLVPQVKTWLVLLGHAYRFAH
jgi:hypothetical protein